MVCLIAPFRDQKFNSVNEAIGAIKEYLIAETPLDIELIYFIAHKTKKEEFLLKFLLTGFLEQDKQSITVLDGITKVEADESWITIFK